jgi:hypothetical protein
VRFAPEWCALGVALAAALVYFMIPHCPALIVRLALGAHLTPATYGMGQLPGMVVFPYQHLAGAALVYGLAGMVLVFVPVAFVAAAWAGERRRETLEGLVLTPVHRSLMVRGRFRAVAGPWLRLAVYLLPVYFAAPLMAALSGELGSGICEYSFGAAPWSVSWLTWLGGLRGWYIEHLPANSLHGWVLPGMRWVNDVSSLYFAAAVAYYCSVRAADHRRAAAWSYLVAGLGLFLALSPDCWWALGTLKARLLDGYVELRMYWLLTMAALALRVVIAVILLARVARNFDAYALDETVGRERRPPPLRSQGLAPRQKEEGRRKKD